MKVILSRKGFDSSNGGFASPIMPSGRLLSLPIPVTEKGEEGTPYDDLKFNGQCLSEVINQLSKSKFEFDTNPTAHLDPDLDRDRLENRGQRWGPAFGQVGPPQGLLKSVDVGDLFLFFGWFRPTRLANGHLCYQEPVRELHVIFGWLQVGQRFHPVTRENCPVEVEDHPHVRNVNGPRYGLSNTIYIAADELTVFGQSLGVRGAGTFPCFKRSLQLTVPGRSRACWCLPRWFEPERPKEADADWQCCDNRVPFDSQAYGQCQEFVFNMPDIPEAIDWVKALFNNCC